MTDTVKLAIAAAAAVRRLRRGEAVVGTFRGELVGLLLGIVTVGAGRPAVGATDPGELIRLLVSLCRAAGMSGPEMVSRFNDAVERRD
jgi:hypothetical protein